MDNRLTTAQIDRMIAGESRFGILPLIIAAKAAGKVAKNVTQNVARGGAGQPAEPVQPVQPVPPDAPVLPVLLVSAAGLAIGGLLGYRMSHG